MRIDALLRAARGAGLERADAEILLAAASGRRRTQLLAWPEQELDAAVLHRFADWQRRRLDGEPVAYLLGQQEFHGLTLTVDAHVLVPRPESELLVDFALDRQLPASGVRVADLGTGSGAIACALAHQRSGWSVSAVDRSAGALAVARQNGARLGLTNIVWLEGDWFGPLSGQRFDVLLSNPPYLAADDPHLADLRHEPRQALVGGEDALACLDHLVTAAPPHLLAGGWLALEHGWTQAAAVRALLTRRGFRDVASRQDLAGIERVSYGRWPADPHA